MITIQNEKRAKGTQTFIPKEHAACQLDIMLYMKLAEKKQKKKKNTRRWRNEGARIVNFHFENQNRRPRIFLGWSRTILKEIENIFQVFQSNFVKARRTTG